MSAAMPSVICTLFEGGGGMKSSHVKQGHNINNKLLIAPPLLSNNINTEEALIIRVRLPWETFLPLIALIVKNCICFL